MFNGLRLFAIAFIGSILGAPSTSFAFLGMNAGATLQGPLPAWTKQLGSKGDPKQTTIKSAATDSSGNVYVTGYTYGGYDGGTLTGSTDYFLAKYDSTGAKLWTAQKGVASKVLQASAVAVDSSSNVIIAGTTNAGLDGNSLTGTNDFFVVKYDSTGTRLWTQQLGVASQSTYGNAVAVDSSGNVFVAGTTFGGLDGNTLSGVSDTDFYVTKYNSSGTKQWTKQLGASGNFTYGMGVATDSTGNIFVVGYTTAGLDGNSRAGAYDFFVTKYDPTGAKIWTKQLGTVGATTYGLSVATDTAGNIFVGGTTSGALDGYDQWGMGDAFITKYNASGTKQWTQLVDVVNQDTRGYKVTTDSSGNVLITGDTDGAIDSNAQTGDLDAFVAKYDTTGTRLWSRQLGVPSRNTQGDAVATDSSGNIFMTGFTQGDLDGNTRIGINDLFLTKYSSTGSKLWTKQKGSYIDSAGTVDNAVVATDASGNAYVAGYTDTGLDGNSQTGTEDMFLSKYDSTGARLWTRQMGVAAKTTEAFAVTTDLSGNIYVTGTTDGALDGQTLTGFQDFFLVKYNSTGTKQWTRLLGAASEYTHAWGVVTDSSGNVYVGGSTGGGVDGNSLSGSSNTDHFLTKYDSSGTKLWTKQSGPSGTAHVAYGLALAVDSSNNVFLAGYSNAPVDGQTYMGNYDMYVTKYNSSGTKLWTRELGVSSTYTYTYGVATDPSGNVFVTGYTQGNLDGNTKTGSSDMFVTKYDSSGNKQWTRLLGATSKFTEGQAITTDSFGNVYIAGDTTGGVDGNPTPGGFSFFVTKYTSAGVKQWTKELGSGTQTVYNYGVAFSALGQLYVTGSTDGALDSQTLQGAQDVYISQFIGN